MTTHADPSLLRFLQDRLSEDVDLVIENTPMFGLQVNNSEFEERFLDRGALLNRVSTDRTIVALVVEAMQAEQGMPPASPLSFEGGAATDLGSGVLKLIAARFSAHPDYRLEWTPPVRLVEL